MIYLIGDSHTDKIRFSSPQNEEINPNIKYSFHQGRGAYSFDFAKENLENLKSTDLVIPWFGYNDCKVHLPVKLDTIYTVKRYMNRVLGFFENSVRFMEPIPQLIKVHEPGVTDHPYEERVKQHDLFVKYLHIYSEQFGLEEPIKTSEIIGVDVNTIQVGLESRLEPFAYKKILDNLIEISKARAGTQI
jgi:hypothetical protein